MAKGPRHTDSDSNKLVVIPGRLKPWIARTTVFFGLCGLFVVATTANLAGQENKADKAADDNKGDKSDNDAAEMATEPVKVSHEIKLTRVPVQKVEDIENVEDPYALLGSGQHWLKEGNEELARASFEAAIAKDEINNYAGYAGKPYGDAMLHEYMGDFEAARKIWDERFEADILTTWFMFRTFSIDPKADERIAEAKKTLESKVEDAKAGGSPHIYTTKKGKKRLLTEITAEEAIETWKKGEKLRYVYIDKLDLTEQEIDYEVNCQRCVVGELNTWGSTFKQRFAFRGFVMKDAHLGRKWRGEVNKSSSIEGGHFDTLYMGFSVVLGNLNLDSVNIHGRLLNLPLMVIEGEGNLKKMVVSKVAEFRYAWFGGDVSLKGAEFGGSTYFGHAHMGGLDMSRVIARKNVLYFNSAVFTGPVTIEKCELGRGATFEASKFYGPVVFRQTRVNDRLNFSLTRFYQGLKFNYVEVTVFDFLGAHVHGVADFNDCVFVNTAKFSIDSLVRRKHIDDVDPLHTLYKQYQGDEDAESDLTDTTQYGVTHPDDLTSRFYDEVSFGNTIFDKVVSFEGVRFGQEGAGHTASFYNSQFYGEAHFERAKFYAHADFRTIFASEISFDLAVFYGAWMLDDCNIPGRLSLTSAVFQDGANMSFNNTNIKWFGIDMSQVVNEETGEKRLFYENCVEAGKDNEMYHDDPRLQDARYDSVNEEAITDKEEIAARAERICADRIIDAYVALIDSFGSRGMNIEEDWAYWHERHFKNRRNMIKAPIYIKPLYFLKKVIFEWAFGWGVRLQNLLATGFVTVIIFTILHRFLCADMVVEWDGRPYKYKELPFYAMVIVSFHSFLGGVGDWNTKSSQRMWQMLYTTEIIVGIILITFFIGAYTRMVLA